MDESRVEGYRNFATKLWNATRFCQANGIGASTSLAAPAATHAVNKWIIGEVVETLAELDKAMADLRFDAAAHAIYQFTWATFCDWYLELIKGQIDDETKAVAGWVLDQILVMLHPFMPFVTEELWHAQGERPYELIVAKWPQPEAAVDKSAKGLIGWAIALVRQIRAARSELNVPPGARVGLRPQSDGGVAATAGAEMLLDLNREIVSRLARVEIHDAESVPAEGANAQIVMGDVTFILDLEGVIDVAAEKARLAKALEASQKEAKSLAGRLGNPAFVEKAKPEAVDKARADHAHHTAEAERLEAALARLG
jgi:valyl-tRNA synthetase